MTKNYITLDARAYKSLMQELTTLRQSASQLEKQLVKMQQSLAKLEQSNCERKQAEDVLQKSEQRFRQLFELTPKIAMQSYDRHRRVIAWNKASEILYGYSQAEAVGKQLEDLIIPPSMREWVVQAVDEWVSYGVPIPPSELALLHKNGSTVSVYSSHIMLDNVAGEPEIICLDIDLSDRKAAEVALKELYMQTRTKSQELEQALIKLQRTQAQMIQAEKMSSLGQLVAGIAHEINNPVGFIQGNLSHARDYMQQLLHLINLYQHYYPQPVKEIETEIKTIELDFLTDDLSKLFNSMEVGTDRIGDIILSLRNFSRLDEANFKTANIHEGIDSTLMILQNRLKAKPNKPEIQVVKEYDQLPQVECYAGQLNQVFLNLLNNAIDALEDKKQHQPCIQIRSKKIHSDWIAIQITDNGSGMSKEIQERIFDPFFTTKPVGKGTGLGLAVSYQIITELHRGKLYCQSALGAGTEFTIKIPIRQSKLAPL